MKKLKIFTLTTVLLALGSCKKNEPEPLKINVPSSEYLIFGSFHGFCLGDGCNSFYLIGNDQVFKDINHTYPSRQKFYSGNYIELADTTFDKVGDLINYFPDSLLQTTDTIFGCPDCTDQGGFYVEYNYNGTRRYWIIDHFQMSVPTYLHHFMDKMNEYKLILND